MNQDETTNPVELLRALAGIAAPKQDQRITISNSAAALVVGLIGIAAIMYAVFAVREANIKTSSVMRSAATKAWATAKVHAAELKAVEQIRQRDMQEMAQLRGRVLSLEQHKDALLSRVSKLEASQNAGR